jgi:hypothetical protein
MKKFRALSSLSTALSAMLARHTSGGQSQPQRSIAVGPPNIPPPYVNQPPKPRLFARLKAKDQALQSLRVSGRWNPNQKQKRKDRRRAFAAGNSRAFK